MTPKPHKKHRYPSQQRLPWKRGLPLGTGTQTLILSPFLAMAQVPDGLFAEQVSAFLAPTRQRALLPGKNQLLGWAESAEAPPTLPSLTYQRSSGVGGLVSAGVLLPVRPS